MGQVPEKTEDDPFKDWKPTEFQNLLAHHEKIIKAPAFWGSRGIGYGGGISLVTGNKISGPDISGYVTSKEEGLRVSEIFFGGRAYLDFRMFEPNYIQVKICVEEEHKDVLKRIDEAVYLSHGVLRIREVLWALDPIHYPGYDPMEKSRKYWEHHMKKS